MTIEEIEKRRDDIELELLSLHARRERIEAQTSLLRAESYELEIQYVKLAENNNQTEHRLQKVIN